MLACRAADRCVDCSIEHGIDRAAASNDYCNEHRRDFNDPQLRGRKVRYRKAVEHLFLELARATGNAATPRP